MDLASLKAKFLPERRILARNAAIVGAAALLLSFGASMLIRGLVALPSGARLKEPSLVATAKPAAGSDAASESEPAPAAAATKSHKLPKRNYIDPILARNIFDSTAIGSSSSEGEVTGEGRKTDLKATLLATIVAEPEEYSSCLIAAGEGGDARVEGYGIGDQLLSDATILQIEQKKVIIRRSDGSVEYLVMGEEPARKEDPAKAESTEGIAKADENKFTIEQSVLQEALSNIDQLAAQLRATPHMGPDGKVDGFRLSSIRRGSLLQKLGIKNGDVVHSVNGIAFTDTASAMGAYQTLQNEKNFSFEVTRRNQKQTFEYDVR